MEIKLGTGRSSSARSVASAALLALGLLVPANSDAIQEYSEATELQRSTLPIMGAVPDSVEEGFEVVELAPGLVGLDSKWQDKLQGLLTSDFASTRQKYLQICSNETFQGLSGEVKQKVLDIASATFGDSDAVVRILDQRFNDYPLILSKDAEGKTLLDNVHELSQTHYWADSYFDVVEVRYEVFKALLTELAEAGQVNQGSSKTCASANPSWDLCLFDPAEASRLICGLFAEGEVEFRKPGEFLELDPGSARPDGNTSRSIVERVFQSALMEYANGSSWDYRAPEDETVHEYMGTLREPGLFAEEKAKILSSFYDVEYRVYRAGVIAEENKKGQISKIETTQADLLIIVESNLERPVHCGIRWRDNVKVEGDSLDTTSDEPKSTFHTVAVTRIENGRVYFRNPHGPSEHGVGAEIKDSGPERRVEDPASGFESMNYDEFLDRISTVVVPEPEEPASSGGGLGGFWNKAKAWLDGLR